MTSFDDDLKPEELDDEDHKVWQAHYRSYLEHLRYRHRLASRVPAAENVKKFWRWMEARQLLPSSLTPAHFKLYSQELEAGIHCRFTQSYSPVTLSALRRAVLNWTAYLKQKKLLFLDPFADFSAGYAAKTYRLKVLTVDQVKAILACPDPDTPLGLRNLAILEITYGSGLRVGEIAALTMTSFDLARGCLHLRHTKNRWDRVVPITANTSKCLKRYLEESRPLLLQGAGHENPNCYGSRYRGDQAPQALWLSAYGKPLNANSFSVVIQSVLPHLNFHFSFHDLRRACATHLLQGGANIGQIGLLLGHECLESTTLYARVQLMDLQRIHRQCHPLG